MTPTRRNLTVRLDDELFAGMQLVWDRDGVQPSEQIRRGLKSFLEARGVKFKKSDRKRVATRKRS